MSEYSGCDDFTPIMRSPCPRPLTLGMPFPCSRNLVSAWVPLGIWIVVGSVRVGTSISPPSASVGYVTGKSHSRSSYGKNGRAVTISPPARYVTSSCGLIRIAAPPYLGIHNTTVDLEIFSKSTT